MLRRKEPDDQRIICTSWLASGGEQSMQGAARGLSLPNGFSEVHAADVARRYSALSARNPSYRLVVPDRVRSQLESLV